MQYSSTSEAKEHTGQFQNIYILQFMYLISINQTEHRAILICPQMALSNIL